MLERLITVLISVFSINFFVYIGILLAYVCTPHVFLVLVRPKEDIGSPSLELQIVVNHHVGAWNEAWVLYRSSMLLTSELSQAPVC